MSFAWETTPEDLEMVLQSMGKPSDNEHRMFWTVENIRKRLKKKAQEDEGLRSALDYADELLAAMAHETVKSLDALLDHYKIERAALYGSDIDAQTECAHEEIERQIRILAKRD